MAQERLQLPLLAEDGQPLLRVVDRTIRGAKYNLEYLCKTIELSKYAKQHRLSSSVRDEWVGKRRSNYEHPLHKMAARVGAFPPALARDLIARYTQPGDTILDPFSGKGTTVLEALLQDRYAIGNDLAPDAFVLTHAKAKRSTLMMHLPTLQHFLCGCHRQFIIFQTMFNSSLHTEHSRAFLRFVSDCS